MREGILRKGTDEISEIPIERMVPDSCNPHINNDITSIMELQRSAAYAEGQLDMLRYVIKREVRCPSCGATFRHGVLENDGSLLSLLWKKASAGLRAF